MEGNIARLSGPAARLLLVLLLARSEGREKIKAGEIRESAGLPNTRIFNQAREQLERLGFARLVKEGQFYVVNAFALNGSVIAKSVSQSVGVDVSKYVYTNIHGTDAKPAERDELDLTTPAQEVKNGPRSTKSENVPIGTNSWEDELENVLLGTNSPKNVPIGTNSKMDSGVQIPENVPGGTKSRCVEVDRMDDSGDLARSKSPAQARRREQIAVVQDIWAKFFPTQPPLIAENAKRLLSDSDQSAEAVYDLLEYVQSRNPGSPLQYALTTARNKSQPRPEAPISTAFVPGPEPAYDPVEQERVDRAAHKARVAHWRRFHPDGPVPTDL